MTEAFGLSDVGPVRQNNEDCLLSDLALNIFAVADGMGGEAAGEVASRLAIDAIEEFIRQSDTSDYFTWPFGFDPTLSEGANRLSTAFRLANQRIRNASSTWDEYAGMGTTAVCALISGRQLTVAHVGDSRLYLFADGALTQVTADDSWAAALPATDRNGDVQSVGARPGCNVLTNALGAEADTEIHLCERELSGGELFLLCSDGLHGVVEHEMLRMLLAQSDDLEALGRTLISAAMTQGTYDNVTALLVRYWPDS